MVWTAFQKYATIGVQFISGIILARLLTPYDYGCIGMLSIFMLLADTFIYGGFGSALIQKKRPTQDDYSTVFWWNMVMALLMYIVLFFSAPTIAKFYDIPLLCSVLRVNGIVLFIHAFNLVQSNQLQKQLNFKAISIVSFTSSVFSLGITIWMAYSGFGVWALVSQNLIAAAIPSIIFWFYLKWRPSLLFSWKSFRELFGFGFYMLLSSLINTFGQQIQGLLIGKVYNPSTMGYYSKALSTESLASQSISSVMTQVTYPLYAEAQNNKQLLGNMIKRITMTISFITFPLLFLLILLAKPIFVLLYSERWLASVPYFQVLCFVGMITCMQSANLQAIAAIGKSKTMFVWTVIKRSVGIGVVVLGLFLYGMKGLLSGVVIQNTFAYFVNIGLVSKYIGYKWTQQIKDFMPVGIAALIAAMISYGSGLILHQTMYLDAIIKLGSYLLIYLGWSVLFRPAAYNYFISIMPSKFRFWEKIKRQ